jgi:general secretion pathway protein G
MLRNRDRGFSLVEMLIVVVVLGIVATVVTISMRGVTDRGTESVCDYDERALSDVIEVYVGEHGVDSLPGGTPAERMQALVDAGLLKSPSTHYEIAADDELVPLGICAA